MFISIEYSPDDFDVVKLPDCRNYEIEQLQNDFFSWMFNKNNNHKYWRYSKGQKIYCEYDTNAFIEWLNNTIFLKSNEKAMIYLNKNVSTSAIIVF